MIPVDQDEFYPGGNCLEACIASILEFGLDSLRGYYAERWAFQRKLEAYHEKRRAELEPGAFEEVYRHLEAKQRIERCLGFMPLRITPHDTALDGVNGGGFRPVGATPRGYSIASGPGPRKKPDGDLIYHSCVALDGAIVHDPHPSRGGLVTIEWFEILAPVIP